MTEFSLPIMNFACNALPKSLSRFRDFNGMVKGHSDMAAAWTWALGIDELSLTSFSADEENIAKTQKNMIKKALFNIGTC